MKFSKVFSTTIKLHPKDIQSALDKVLLNKLETSFKLKCYKDSFVVDNFKIIERGDYEINKSELGGTMRVNVRFSADVITYATDEYIIGTIKEIKKKFCLIQGKYFVLYKKVSPAIIKEQKLKVGKTIIMSPKNVAYIPNRPEISIIDYKPFQYPSSQVLKCTPDINKDMLKEYIGRIEELKKTLPKNWNTLHKKLMTTRESNKGSNKGSKKFKLADMKLFGNIVQYQPLDEEVYSYSKDAVISLSGTGAYQIFLTNTIKYLELLHDELLPQV